MSTKSNLPPVALVVDDDHLINLLCTRTLEKLGLQVICCDSSAKAARLAELHAHRIRLFIVDVVLAAPELRLNHKSSGQEDDGARLLSLLEHFCKNAVAVQISAYSTEELTERGYPLEAKHFLQKPFTPAILRTLVHNLLPDIDVPSEDVLPTRDVTWYG